MRELFEREMRAVIRYAELMLEPGMSETEIKRLLSMAKRRLADATKVAAPEQQEKPQS